MPQQTSASASLRSAGKPLKESADLGFAYRHRKGGAVELLQHGRLAVTLRGREAQEFLGEVAAQSEEAQQLMARLTGNYKRGNERQASQHPRNQGQGESRDA